MENKIIVKLTKVLTLYLFILILPTLALLSLILLEALSNYTELLSFDNILQIIICSCVLIFGWKYIKEAISILKLKKILEINSTGIYSYYDENLKQNFIPWNVISTITFSTTRKKIYKNYIYFICCYLKIELKNNISDELTLAKTQIEIPYLIYMLEKSIEINCTNFKENDFYDKLSIVFSKEINDHNIKILKS